MFETPPTFHNPGHDRGLPTPEIARAAWDAWSSGPNSGPVGVLMLRPPGPDMPPLPPTPGCGVWLAALVHHHGAPEGVTTLALFGYEPRRRAGAADLRAWFLTASGQWSPRQTIENGAMVCLAAHRLAVAHFGPERLMPIPTA
jgi:hypothetical protein